MTLTEFLTAMIDGDERIARQTNPHGPEWTEWDEQAVAAVLWDAQPHAKRCAWRMSELQEPCTCGYPARVLAECEAKRRILDDLAAHLEADYEAMESPIASAGWHAKTRALNGVVRLLALPYADHPDYDEAWRP